MPTATHTGIPTGADQLTASRVTKSLLGYGVIAGPVYVLTSLIQAATRDGFDLTRHSWSQLAAGGPGWIQTTNLALTGLMVIACAVGLRRALTGGVGAGWAPRLIAVFGVGMIVAAVFPADAGGGFPVGAPEAFVVTGTGLTHLAAAGFGFVALTGGLLVLARRLTTEGFRAWASATRIGAVFFLATFLGMASGMLGSAGTSVFVAGIVVVFGLLTAVSWHRYRQLPDTCGDAARS